MKGAFIIIVYITYYGRGQYPVSFAHGDEPSEHVGQFLANQHTIPKSVHVEPMKYCQTTRYQLEWTNASARRNDTVVYHLEESTSFKVFLF